MTELVDQLFGLMVLVAFVVMIIFIAIGLYWLWQHVEGLELTPEQIADERKTQICIIYNISNEECWMVYGDIDNDWEPEKK